MGTNSVDRIDLGLEKILGVCAEKSSRECHKSSKSDVPTSYSSDLYQEVSFKGGTFEYFKIWLTNLAFTVITLGIYSPWAKVRREKYFLNNTFCGSSSFDYTADPVAILKGRLLVIALFMICYTSSLISLNLTVLLNFATVLSFPFFFLAALRFRARNTTFRNIRFSFDGSVWQIAKLFILFQIPVICTLGLLAPLINRKRKEWLARNLWYGNTKFNCSSSTADFYKLYIKAIIAHFVFA